jgi:hypothetical protein
MYEWQKQDGDFNAYEIASYSFQVQTLALQLAGVAFCSGIAVIFASLGVFSIMLPGEIHWALHLVFDGIIVCSGLAGTIVSPPRLNLNRNCEAKLIVSVIWNYWKVCEVGAWKRLPFDRSDRFHDNLPALKYSLDRSLVSNATSGRASASSQRVDGEARR